MKSLVKWAGGKRWVLERFAHLLPADITAYHEPFCGSAAVAAHYLGKVPCVLSDRNERLMAMYRGVRDDPDTVIAELRRWPYDAETFRAVRDNFNCLTPGEPFIDSTTAAWFIYLNRTCFNGLYRTNRKGEFNVPFGRYTNPTICDEETIRAWHEMLRGAALRARPWEKSIELASRGDFVFLDPPYLGTFTGYQAGGFSTEEQARLVRGLESLDIRGVRWMLTNSAAARGLYDGWNVREVQVARPINSRASARGAVGEIIVTNYDVADAHLEQAA